MICSVCKQDRLENRSVGRIEGVCTQCTALILSALHHASSSDLTALTPKVSKHPPTKPVDDRLYYRVRMGDFETIVDARDVELVDDLWKIAVDKLQPWYYTGEAGDTRSVVSLTYAQYCDWLHR